jgi:two-component system sensor histidine kinase YesM
MLNLARYKIKQQLIVLIAISIFIMITVQAVYYYRFYKLTEERAKVHASNIINQIVEKLNTIASDIEHAAFDIAYNPNNQEYFNIEDINADNYEYKIYMYKFVSTSMDYIKSSNKNIYDISVSDFNKGIVRSGNSNIYDAYDQLEKKYNYYSDEFKEPIFTSIVKDKYDNQFYYAYIMPIFASYRVKNLFEKVGAGVILCRTDQLTSLVKNVEVSKNSQLLILDKENTIIVDSTGKKQGETFTDEHVNLNDDSVKIVEVDYKGIKSIIQHEEIESTGWKVISIIPIKELTSDMDSIREFGLATGVIMSVILIVIGIIIVRSITNPISGIINFMKGIEDNYMNKRIAITNTNEVGILAVHINRMLSNIENMNTKILNSQAMIYELKISQKQAQLSALQSQINPHFLYNTLNCLSGIGLANGISEITAICSSMAKIFRYSIRFEDHVYIHEEIECIKDYLNIVQIRYQGKIKYDIDIDEKLMNLKMSKMILQPIIENGVQHGLESKNAQGKILIKGFLVNNETVCFEVIDDGVGMSVEVLNKSQGYIEDFQLNSGAIYKRNNDDKSKFSIGLININRRIKLAYGEEYGINIESVEGQGTDIKLILPIIS